MMTLRHCRSGARVCLLAALALSFSTALAPQRSRPLSSAAAAAAAAAAGGKKPGKKPSEPSWAARRVAGDSAAKQGREGRAKPWETQGDALYHSQAATTDVDFDGARTILTSLEKERPVAKKQEREPVKGSPVMWGACSVGPVMKSRLVAAGLEAPTAIQEAAFVPISKAESTLLVSETGSGKTMAFMAPILVRLDRHAPLQCLIVCPSREVALQTRAVVDVLWPSNDDGYALQVLVKDQEEDVLTSKPPLVAGTPRTLLAMVEKARASGMDIQRTLKVVVIDEVDQLLNTAADLNKPDAWKPSDKKQNAAQNAAWKPSSCERLIKSFQWKDTQLVCASASVGRSLRRQLQRCTGAQSVDAACKVVSGVSRRHGVPRAIEHKAALYTDDVLDALVATMLTLPPRRSILFGASPAKLCDQLRERGFPARLVNGTEEKASLALEEAGVSESWEKTELLVTAERFARGLDTPLGYAFLLEGPPKTAAGYLHLAGRVGRSGSSGTAITFLRPAQVATFKRHLEQLNLDLTPGGFASPPKEAEASS